MNKLRHTSFTNIWGPMNSSLVSRLVSTLVLLLPHFEYHIHNILSMLTTAMNIEHFHHHHSAQCTLFSTLLFCTVLYPKCPCKLPVYVCIYTGAYLGEITYLEFQNHKNVNKFTFRTLKQAGTNTCLMGCQTQILR